MKYLLMFLMFLFAEAAAFAEMDANLIVEFVGEDFDKVSIKPDNTRYLSILGSFTPQFVWKQGRTLALLNVQIYGELGLTDPADSSIVSGSFGREGLWLAQIKVDSFFHAFFGESDFYFKGGRYTADLPWHFGGLFETGTIEAGWWPAFGPKIFFQQIWYNWNKEDFSDADNQLIHSLALDVHFSDSRLKVRFPFSFSENMLDLRVFPSAAYQYHQGVWLWDLTGGVGWRENISKEQGTCFGLRSEVEWEYIHGHSTSVLVGLISAFDESRNNYKWVSVDNKYFEQQYGSHVDYLYQEAGNVGGLVSLGVRQTGTWDYSGNGLMKFWVGGSLHWSWINTAGDGHYIGTVIGGDVRFYDLIDANSLLELYASLLIPGNYSTVGGTQQRNLGVQIIIKLQQTLY